MSGGAARISQSSSKRITSTQSGVSAPSTATLYMGDAFSLGALVLNKVTSRHLRLPAGRRAVLARRGTAQRLRRGLLSLLRFGVLPTDGQSTRYLVKRRGQRFESARPLSLLPANP